MSAVEHIRDGGVATGNSCECGNTACLAILELDARLKAIEERRPPTAKTESLGGGCIRIVPCPKCGSKFGCPCDKSPQPEPSPPPADVPSAEEFVAAYGPVPVCPSASTRMIKARDAQWRGQAVAQHEKYVRSFKGLKDRAERAEARVRELEQELKLSKRGELLLREERDALFKKTEQAIEDRWKLESELAAIRAKTGGG